MWKFSRNFVHTRWCTGNKRHANKRTQSVVCSKPVHGNVSFDRKKFSGENENGEKFSKQNERFGNFHFRYLLFNSSLFETAGFLGTVSILLNVHSRHFNFIRNDEGRKSHTHLCMFPKRALAMQQAVSSKNETNDSHVGFKTETRSDSFQNANPSEIPQNVSSTTKFFENWRDMSNLLAANVENQIGISNLESNNKSSFRYFQRAAQLGSVQGFYNLGLCYEQGIGTKMNLTRAAYCYRQAAKKGHGMASFNLAHYFLNGMGSLPVDTDTAHLLLEQAASKGVMEAELYLGLECLEEKRWTQAYELFNSLAERDNLDGKYYLGLCYENGWGTNKDEKAAVEIYSQNSNSGHDKSLLSLSRCYEEGLGCNANLDFALALCQRVSIKSSEEAKEAISRIETKKENLKLKELFRLKFTKGEKKTNFHSSSSNPELSATRTIKARNQYSSFFSSHLDLVRDIFSNKPKNSPSVEKPSFFLGEHEPKLGLNIFMRQYPKTTLIVATKT